LSVSLCDLFNWAEQVSGGEYDVHIDAETAIWCWHVSKFLIDKVCNHKEGKVYIVSFSNGRFLTRVSDEQLAKERIKYLIY
jgi:hypothetical protein